VDTIPFKFFLIISRKNNPTRKYNNVAPIVVETSTINIPHHLPKTKPENINGGIANPSNNTQIMEKLLESAENPE
jgi:hypothetical protein